MNYWIWLSTVKDLGPIKKIKLLEKFLTPEKIFYAEKKELLSVEGITEKVVKNLEESKNIDLLVKYEAYIKTHNIQLVNFFDKIYPEKLKNIYAPPITLFAKGDINLLQGKSLAVVGCRNPSDYGLKVSKELVRDISRNGFTIISGMARGIDAVAHKAAIESNGKTIAVLGCGVDVVYPRENMDLYVSILKKGLIISEYIVGTEPKAENFPLRNRIISGLSDGVLVVEARKQSGTMITTDFALEQGRELYVVPGNINSITSEGTNNLIKEGAKVVTCADDILEDF